MAILEKINETSDLKKLNIEELKLLCTEIREEIVETVKNNGGHLSSNLGAVELTVAIHYVFDLNSDKLIFDVGHQCYTHKILTGRKENFKSIRTTGGLSGFSDRNESPFDINTTGHSGTSIPITLGLLKARDSLNENYNVIDVVGDGSFVNGLNLEAMTARNIKPKGMLVILNDNGMSISRNRNALYRFISRNTTTKSYLKTKTGIKKVFGNSFVVKFLRKIRTFIKRVFNKNNYIERFGFKYVTGVDGNNLEKTIKALSRIKEVMKNKAVFLHVRTKKGYGYEVAEKSPDLYHGVGKGLTVTQGDFSEAFGNSVYKLIEEDGKNVVITAGMTYGTGLDKVMRDFKNNFFDVGIAEECAITEASGLALGGLKPIVAIYSTFMQRGYDEILHDVCLSDLPVVLCLDRAGLVGADGKTHQGVFDLSFLSHLPNMHIFAPSDTSEFDSVLRYAVKLNRPVAIRYPNGKIPTFTHNTDINLSLWEVLKDGQGVSILAVGPRMISLAYEIADKSDGTIEIINARSVKPLDEKVLERIKNNKIITLEENAIIGGFGSLVSDYYKNKCENAEIFSFGIKDEFVSHGDIKSQMKDNGLTAENIIGKARINGEK